MHAGHAIGEGADSFNPGLDSVLVGGEGTSNLGVGGFGECAGVARGQSVKAVCEGCRGFNTEVCTLREVGGQLLCISIVQAFCKNDGNGTLKTVSPTPAIRPDAQDFRIPSGVGVDATDEVL